MKKIPAFACMFFLAAFSFAQSDEIPASSDSSESKNEDVVLNPKTGFPVITEKPFLIYNFGAAFSQVTRIISQEKYNRSNFVWQDYLIGLYLEAVSKNVKPADSMLRIAAYYPFYYTFNGMEQPAKQAILYAFDAYWGPLFKTDMWHYFDINFSFGPHFLYQLSDEFHHVELGGAVLLGVELPVTRKWTVCLNGLASLDYGNLGSNREIFPYNYVYNYQIELGFRRSKKSPNKYSYIKPKKEVSE
ncbi:hypothetical protein [Treponema sp.]|uniref:hypothetical protein n=1 Tax=Treponema sp. TaxID=166 RepID=UPI00388DFD57